MGIAYQQARWKGKKGKFSSAPAMFGGLPSLKNSKYTRMRHFKKQNSKMFSPDGPLENVFSWALLWLSTPLASHYTSLKSFDLKAALAWDSSAAVMLLPVADSGEVVDSTVSGPPGLPGLLFLSVDDDLRPSFDRRRASDGSFSFTTFIPTLLTYLITFYRSMYPHRQIWHNMQTWNIQWFKLWS